MLNHILGRNWLTNIAIIIKKMFRNANKRINCEIILYYYMQVLVCVSTNANANVTKMIETL